MQFIELFIYTQNQNGDAAAISSSSPLYCVHCSLPCLHSTTKQRLKCGFARTIVVVIVPEIRRIVQISPVDPMNVHSIDCVRQTENSTRDWWMYYTIQQMRHACLCQGFYLSASRRHTSRWDIRGRSVTSRSSWWLLSDSNDFDRLVGVSDGRWVTIVASKEWRACALRFSARWREKLMNDLLLCLSKRCRCVCHEEFGYLRALMCLTNTRQ